PGDRPGCRRQLADDQTEQRRLAGAVYPEQARAPAAERGGDAIEHACAVRPREREAVENDRGVVSGGHAAPDVSTNARTTEPSEKGAAPSTRDGVRVRELMSSRCAGLIFGPNRGRGLSAGILRPEWRLCASARPVHWRGGTAASTVGRGTALRGRADASSAPSVAVQCRHRVSSR